MFRSVHDQVLQLDKPASYQFLYKEGATLHLMNMQTFDEEKIDEELLGLQKAFLEEGMEVTVRSLDGIPISASIPQSVTCEVAEDAIEAKNDHKHVRLKNGSLVRVPRFISEGDRIVLDTETGEYQRRCE